VAKGTEVVAACSHDDELVRGTKPQRESKMQQLFSNKAPTVKPENIKFSELRKFVLTEPGEKTFQ
jgi:hypothetical protein